MTITLEAIRAAGGIVHSDGNIFFRDINMLQGLAGAAPAAMVRIAEVQHARAASQRLAQPVLYVSPGQLANHSNPEGPESEKAGRYLPARVTPAGKFTQPLYAGEAPATVEPRARDLLGIVRTAQAEARRLINGEDSGSDLAQTKLDLPETLRVLEHALSQPAAVAGSALDVTLDEDQADLLRDMLGDPAEYEEALTVRLIVCDGHRGHGLYVAQAEYQDEGAALLAPLPAPAAPTAPQDWRIDTSTGRGILVYKNCSVIEAEQAPYVLGLIAADAAAAHAPALEAPAAPTPVGEAGTMPGTSGFTMACFHADKVPLGTKLYTQPMAAAPQAPAAPAEGLAADVKAVLGLLEEHEWAEHCTKTPLGQRLEAAITELHNEIHAAEDAPYAAAPAVTIDPASFEGLIAAVRSLPTTRATEFDGEESDGTPQRWRNRPFVSRTQLERLLRERVAAPAAPAVDARDPALPSWWPDFIQCVAELPDRNSPEDEPDAMIATAEELGACAIAAQAAAKGAGDA